MSAESLQSSISPVGSLIGPVMDVSMARKRLMQFQQFVKEYLVENEDFGIIPGTPKPTLLKPGADKLCELYGLADDYEVTQRTEDFEKGLFDYEVKCVLMSKAGGFLVSTGLGSCNSYETKYHWRDSKRVCPNCGKDAIIKGKAEYGGGWLCFAKKGGCGAKFSDGDQQIESQTIGRIQNEDVADLKNTILKMAKKRAKIDATLSATRSSGVFTQDIEDWDIPKSSRALDPASENLSKPTGSSQPNPPAQPSTGQPATAQRASQGQGGPTVRIPPSGLRVTVKSVKHFPADKAKKLNACASVVFAKPLKGENQGVSWECAGAWCYHGSLLPLVSLAVGKECQFVIKERDKKLNTSDEWPTHFIDIEDVLFIGAQGYVDGKPVIEEGVK